MKRPIKLILVMGTILLLLPFVGLGQISKSTDTIKSNLLQAAREIMTSAGTCALITVDAEGRPRVRQMDAFPPEEDFTVWFGTNPRSRKVEQIKTNPKVTLYYLEENGAGYVMIHGKAELVGDQEEKDRRWKNGWEAFYPNRAEDYLLIKVSPEWMEVISYAHGIVGDPVTWEPPGLLLMQNEGYYFTYLNSLLIHQAAMITAMSRQEIYLH